mmetsp:Transcript_75747/g.202672  ORF Transcript_75747/g.202672 Transcript_75747/m.202672 type:complete len:217 (-) Transcript_75747:202-852(-)
MKSSLSSSPPRGISTSTRVSTCGAGAFAMMCSRRLSLPSTSSKVIRTSGSVVSNPSTHSRSSAGQASDTGAYCPSQIRRDNTAMFDPSNGRFNANTSYRTQPNAHRSLAEEYPSSLLICSGAMYSGVPTNVWAFFVVTSSLLEPKSPSLATSALSKSMMFAGFRSRCRTEERWRKFRATTICARNRRTHASWNCSCFLAWSWIIFPKSPKSANSMR